MSKVNLYLQWVENYLQDTIAPHKNISLFRKSVYLLFFLKIVLLWQEIPTFYNSFLASRSIDFADPIKWITKLLFFPIFRDHPYTIISLFLLLILLGIFFQKRILSILIFVISLNYLSLMYMAKNGGDLVLGFFIIMLMFLSEKKDRSQTNIYLTNTAWLLLKINFCFFYFINGYGKIIKKMWLTGDAMAITWNLDYFTNWHFVPQWFTNPSVCFITAWVVMLFELSFPFLIWYKSARRFLLPLGIVFHLMIGVFLSLPDFSLTMVIGYLLFYNFNEKRKATNFG